MMAGARMWRCGLAAVILAALSSCNSGSGRPPPPPETRPPPTPDVTQPSPPPKGIPREGVSAPVGSPPSSLGEGLNTGSSASPPGSGTGPRFFDLVPEAPVRYRDVGTISLAISYTLSEDQLRDYLESGIGEEERRKHEWQGNGGSVANAQKGLYTEMMAKIESCLLLICETHDDGVRRVDNDPMVWHWAFTPASNEGGNTVIIIGIYGRSAPDSPWIKLDTIPDIREKATIESRSWFLDNWDKALSMLGALVAFLFTHWFRPGAKKEE